MPTVIISGWVYIAIAVLIGIQVIVNLEQLQQIKRVSRIKEDKILKSRIEHIAEALVALDRIQNHADEQTKQYFIMLFNRLSAVEGNTDALLDLVRTGNKDQQEIKTRLTWSRKRELKDLDETTRQKSPGVAKGKGKAHTGGFTKWAYKIK